VWLITQMKPRNGQPVLEIIADSDAMIVKGLIAVLLTIYSGKTPQEILAIDVKGIFEKLGLDRHLSTARKNGLNEMVRRIRELAAHAILKGERGT
jgi:cysteine desulfuration protein SufE